MNKTLLYLLVILLYGCATVSSAPPKNRINKDEFKDLEKNITEKSTIK